MVAQSADQSSPLYYFERRHADAAACYEQASALAIEGGARCLAAVYTGLAAMAHHALGNVDEPCASAGKRS